MKQIILLILFPLSCFAQDKFIFSKEGFTDYTVTSVPGSQSELYLKTINWIKENYKNPDEVINMKIDNEKIRFTGFREKFQCYSGSCSNIKYVIEISFKDEKYKFDPIELIFSNNFSDNKYNFNFSDTSLYYDKAGNLKKQTKETPLLLENLFNDLNLNLLNYIKEVKKNDW